MPGRSSSTTSSRNSPYDSGVTTSLLVNKLTTRNVKRPSVESVLPGGKWHPVGRQVARPPDNRLDAGKKLPRVEGLADIVVGSHLKAHDPVRLLAHGGQQNDRNPRRFAQVPAKLESILARHHDVQDHEVDRSGAQCAPCGGSALRHGRAKSVALEVARKRFANLAVIIDDQNVRAGFHGREPKLFSSGMENRL